MPTATKVTNLGKVALPQVRRQNCLLRSSGQGQGRTADLPLFRPDVSLRRHRSCEWLRALPTADVCRWLLLLLSPLLSAIGGDSGAGLLFRRSMESVLPVRQNPNPQVSVLPCVRHTP
jgi:hypothetical protein